MPTNSNGKKNSRTVTKWGNRRVGRLVAEDEGRYEDEESELIAGDVGIDGGAASAEEAAIAI